jgi:hypothetical protein
VVKGGMPTIIARLVCGEPNIFGWNILRDYSDMHIFDEYIEQEQLFIGAEGYYGILKSVYK